MNSNSTQSTGDVLAGRMEALKQTRASISEGVQVFTPKETKIELSEITIRPTEKNWEELEPILKQVVNLSGMWKTVRQRFDEGRGAELEAAAEIALDRYKQTAYQYFCGMVDKKHDNWERTLKTVEESWRVRQNALQVIAKLKLEAKSTGYILGLCWKFKESIIRFLGIATEQGYGIKNQAGYFFGIIKNVTATT